MSPYERPRFLEGAGRQLFLGRRAAGHAVRTIGDRAGGRPRTSSAFGAAEPFDLQPVILLLPRRLSFIERPGCIVPRPRRIAWRSRGQAYRARPPVLPAQS